MNKESSSSDFKPSIKDRIRGCLFAGGVGDALGYAIEFDREDLIFDKYGKDGIQEYEINQRYSKAIISDDTQMTLFTANGLIIGKVRFLDRGIATRPSHYVNYSYSDWLKTQEYDYKSYSNNKELEYRRYSWLMDIPELFHRRAPGMTCLESLQNYKSFDFPKSYLTLELNDSKGCGGVMRVAPLGLFYLPDMEKRKEICLEAAEVSAITHSHPLGYIPSSILTYIIIELVNSAESTENINLKQIVLDANNFVKNMFADNEYIDDMDEIIKLAITLSENDKDDLTNIHKLGEGWVAEETLAIAIYCALKYKNNFSKAITTSVNHNGDSDSTGAVTGNIMGALLGYDAIDDKWKKNLELADTILEIADDLYYFRDLDSTRFADRTVIDKYTSHRKNKLD